MFARSRRFLVPCAVLAVALSAATLHLIEPIDRPGEGDRRERGGEGPRPDGPDEWARWRESFLRDENGLIPADGLLRAKAHMEAMRAAQLEGTAVAGIAPGTWTSIGPGNIGGRIRAIVIDPAAPDTMFIGGASGGIWKTTNGGTSWSVVDDFIANLAVTSIVMDPLSPAGNRTYYAGTGEGFFNSDSLRGVGVLRSLDGGSTWTQVASTNNASFHYVNKLAISSTGVLLAATRAGVFRSADGGATFPATSGIASGAGSESDLGAGMTDVEFNPVNPLLAVASSFGGSAWYSTNGGTSWTKATGLPGSVDLNGFTRVELAIAPNAPATVYASVDTLDPSLNPNGGSLYRSLDGGQTYAILIDGNLEPRPLAGQGWYDNLLWVNPANPADVIWGGIDLWRSQDIGVAALEQISVWQNQVVSGSTTAPSSAHADHHIAVAHPGFNGTTNRTVFFGNDGGVYKAADIDAIVCTGPCTTGWTELNNGLAITQFYGAAGHPGTGRIVGGTQDNGTLFHNPALATAFENWTRPFGGDGGWSAYDPTDVNYFYGEYVYAQVHRNTTGGASFSSYIGTPANGLTDAGDSSNAEFIAPFILDPSNPNTMLVGGASLWRSTNVKAAPPAFAVIKNPEALTPGQPQLRRITAIAVAPSNPAHIWIGLRDGRVFRTTNGTAPESAVLGSWTTVDNNLAGTNPFPNRRVTRITVHPANPDIVFVTFGGFATNNLFKTVNGGGAWTDSTGGATGAPNALPDVPVRDVEFHPAAASGPSGRLYLATEVGVFASEDEGATWKVSPSHDGPSNVSVDELFFLGTDLYAVTHGRGLFKTPTTSSPTGPSISTIPNITTAAGVAGSSNFTVADPDTPLASLQLTGSSSNTAAVPNANIQFSGSGANRTVTVTPTAGATGSATITVTVSDGVDAAQRTFTVTIPTQLPTISPIPAQSVVAGASVTANFTIGDPDTPAASLVLTAGSSNPSVIPVSAVQFGGSGAARTVTVTAPPPAAGTVTITVTVADPQGNQASTSFALNIQPLPLVGAPQNFHVVAYNGNNVTFGWTLGAGQLAPTGHVLEGGINPGDVAASIPTGSASPQFTVTAPTGAFYVRLKTVSGANVSAASTEIRIFVNVPAPPSAPANLLGMVNGSLLALSWKNTAAGGAPSLIRLTVTGSLAVTLDLPGSAEYFTYPTVPAGSYTFTVTAINATGSSAPSTPVTLTFPAACSGPPQMPASFQATKSGNVITVTWDLPPAGPAVTRYVLDVTGSFVGSFDTTARTMAGAVGPGSYTITVRGTNGCGNGVSTAPVTITVP